jgi:murein L,D-transpeptidase YafK
MKMTSKLLILLSAIWMIPTSFAQSDEYLPSAIFQMDSRFSHHVLLVEKSTHSLYLYENTNQLPKLVKKYQIATGKKKGDKLVQGDKKTPEGIYQFQRFHSNNELISKYGDQGLIYGAGAFTTNYPNIMDVRAKKTGGGIWLHSTDDDSRVSKGLDSRGCVVAVDADLKDISKYIDLKNTTMIIKHNLDFLRKDTWLKNKEDISNTIITWANAWKSKDFETYINQYSKDFMDPRKGNFYKYRAYKRAVFARKDSPIISFRHISIMNHDEYAVVTMLQDYNSDVIQDVGKKVLYLVRDENYNWKITAEQWYKLEENSNIAFTPAPRFFGQMKGPELKEN